MGVRGNLTLSKLAWPQSDDCVGPSVLQRFGEAGRTWRQRFSHAARRYSQLQEAFENPLPEYNNVAVNAGLNHDAVTGSVQRSRITLKNQMQIHDSFPNGFACQ
jgi:hypothetical protein